MPLLPSDAGSLLVRTDASRTAAWRELLDALGTPSEEGFLPYFTVIDDDTWAGASNEDVAAAAPDLVVVAVADKEALTSAEMPVVVLYEQDRDVQRLRVVPRVMSAIENLASFTMDWEDFARAADADGVFRGFD